MAAGKFYRKSKAQAKPSMAVKKYVAKAIKRKSDKEWVYYNSGVVGAHVVATTFSQVGDSLSYLTQGTATGNRLGDTVLLLGIRLSMRIRTSNATVGDAITVSIIRSPNSAGTSITPNSYYANDTAGFAPVSAAQDDTGLKMVWSKTFLLNPNTAGPSVYFNKYIRFRKPIKVTYLRGVSTGTDASVVDNCCGIFASCFAAAATTIDYTVQGHFQNI